MSKHGLQIANALVWITAVAVCVGWGVTRGVAQELVESETTPSGIWAAAKAGDVEAIKQHLADGVSVNEQDEIGVTPLCWAAMLDRTDAVQALIENGADVDGRNRDKVTPLIAATFFGRTEAVKILIKHGADVNAENEEGQRPLNVLKADWEVTQRIANDLQIVVDRRQVVQGRKQAAEVLRQNGAEEGGNALVVLAIVFGSIAAVAAVVGGIIWLVYRYEKKRTEALAAIASNIGLEFSATKDENLLAKMQVFSIFNKGHSRKMKNVMKAETEIASLTIFDYQYTTGGGKNSHTHRHTIVAMESDSLNFPSFTLRPEGFFEKIGAALGFQDIDFDDHPEFSTSFVLKADNEGAVRTFFDEEMLDLLAQRKGISVESAPGVFIYLRGGRKKPEQIREFMNDGYAIYTAFAQRVSRGAVPNSPNA